MLFPAVFLVVSGINGSSWSFAQSPADPPGTSARCLREQISIEAPVPCPLGTSCCPCGFSALPACSFVLLRRTAKPGRLFMSGFQEAWLNRHRAKSHFNWYSCLQQGACRALPPTEHAEAISHVPGTLSLPRTASAGRALFSHPRMLQSQGQQL